MTFIHEIGNRIRQRRTELGMTQALLARASGLSRATINQLESGSIEDLSLNRTTRVLSVLGLRLDAPTLANPRRASALKIAAQTASISYRDAMSPAVLRVALLRGQVPIDHLAQLATFLDEAPVQLLGRVIDEISQEAAVPPSRLWANMKQVARQLQLPRNLWQ